MLCWLSSVWLFIATLLTINMDLFWPAKFHQNCANMALLESESSLLSLMSVIFESLFYVNLSYGINATFLSCYVLVQVARLWKNVSWDPWSLLNGHSVVLDRAQWKGNSHGTQEHILYEGSCHVTNFVFCLEACLVWIRGERNRKMENKSERDIETQTERDERKRLLLIRLIKLLPSEPSRFTFHNMAGSSIDLCCSGVLTVKKAAPVCTLYYSYCQRTLARYHWLTLGENKSKHWAAVKMALNLFQVNTAKTPTEVSVSHSHSLRRLHVLQAGLKYLFS